jgi:hypothetical protein
MSLADSDQTKLTPEEQLRNQRCEVIDLLFRHDNSETSFVKLLLK